MQAFLRTNQSAVGKMSEILAGEEGDVTEVQWGGTAKNDKEEVMTDENGESCRGMKMRRTKRSIILLQKMMLIMAREMHVIAALSVQRCDRRYGVDLLLFTWDNCDFVMALTKMQ
ncbi:hypothetical protein KXD40_004469 [Peronospora effusa]|nr:hypothetical protein KXD40_004469 [Peronospora effusa]CAI5722432.1 unnamed protein product [Peronospora effusa]